MLWGCADVLCVSVAPFAQAMNALKSATVLSSAPAAGDGAEGHAVLIGAEGVAWRQDGGTKTFRLSENTKQTKAKEEKRREEKRERKKRGEKERESKRREKKRPNKKQDKRAFKEYLLTTHAHTA